MFSSPCSSSVLGYVDVGKLVLNGATLTLNNPARVIGELAFASGTLQGGSSAGAKYFHSFHSNTYQCLMILVV